MLVTARMLVSRKGRRKAQKRAGLPMGMVGALLVAMLTASASVSAAQVADQKRSDRAFSRQEFLRDCPPGSRVQIKLGTATVYVQKEWLGPRASQILWDAFETTCPSGPVVLSLVDFGYAVLPLLDTKSGLGRKLLRFTIAVQRPGPANPSSPWLEHELSESGDKSHGGKPWIEDALLRPPLTNLANVPTLRSYIIHYPPEDASVTSTVEIACGDGGGTGVLRACGINNQRNNFAGLSYRYTVSQSELPIPTRADATSVDPTTEPGALLQFDTRVREWLKEIEQRP